MKTICFVVILYAALSVGITSARPEASPPGSNLMFAVPRGGAKLGIYCGALVAPRQYRIRPRLRCNIEGGLKPEPPRPRSCEFEWAVGLDMSQDGRPFIVCASDAGFGQYGAPILPAGQTWRHYGFRCVVGVARVTCRNTRDHGWFISLRSWRKF